jgi:hypothetical protein
MAPITLSDGELKVLEGVIAQIKNAKELRRAQALLWPDAGESAQALAKRLRWVVGLSIIGPPASGCAAPSTSEHVSRRAPAVAVRAPRRASLIG